MVTMNKFTALYLHRELCSVGKKLSPGCYGLYGIVRMRVAVGNFTTIYIIKAASRYFVRVVVDESSLKNSKKKSVMRKKMWKKSDIK